MSQFNGQVTLTFRDPKDLLALPVDPNSNVMGNRLLQKGKSTVVFGEGGLGKSFISLQLPISQITGRPLFDNPQFAFHGPPLKWAVIQTENGVERQQNDLKILQKMVGEHWSKVERHLLIHTLETEYDSILYLDDDKVRKIIGEFLSDNKVEAVVVDPASDFLPGDLNIDSVMKQGCHLLSKTCRHNDPTRMIVLMHHAITGKQGAFKATGFDRSSFGRNSKMLQGWSRGAINIAPGSDDNSTLVIACGKCSDGHAFDTFAISRSEAGWFTLNNKFDLEKWEKTLIKSAKNGMQKQALELIKLHKKTYPARVDMAKFLETELHCVTASAYNYIELAVKKSIYKPDQEVESQPKTT